jgi:hypothetical protein
MEKNTKEGEREMKYFNLLMVVLLVFGVFIVNDIADAETVCIHGASGQVENPEVFDPPIYYGWGMQLDLYPDEKGWVHFQIPVNSEANRLKKIDIDFEFRDGAMIDKIHLWTDRRVSARNVSWSTDGIHSANYNLDVAEGLNVSLRAVSGWDAGGYRVIIRNVCAEFE